jgi:hypothetical protein
MLVQHKETGRTQAIPDSVCPPYGWVKVDAPDKLLISIGKYGGNLIFEAIGQNAVNEVRDYSDNLEDHSFSSTVPSAPGFYVWEGAVWVEDDDVGWLGEFREATPEDLAKAYSTQSVAEVSQAQR